MHGLGALPDGRGLPALLDLLSDGSSPLREHAAWALAAGPPAPAALAPLAGLVVTGGFGGMLAQRTLETWALTAPGDVTAALDEELTTTRDAGARARLVETLGLVPGWSTTGRLLAHAVDEDEAPQARAAAVAALGDDPLVADRDVARVLDVLADGDGPLAATARTARHDLADAAARLAGESHGPVGDDWRRTADRHPGGLSVVQLFLHADIDAGLTHAGRGDNGGIATLLVQLGDALVRKGRATARTTTVSRGRPADGTVGLDALRDPGHHYASVPLWGPPVHAADAWPLRVAARRAMRRILRSAGPVDVLHLRMADVGSMAAAEAAEELGVPVVLTLAPDPHAQVDAREAAGTLTRRDLDEVDSVGAPRLPRPAPARARRAGRPPRPLPAARAARRHLRAARRRPRRSRRAGHRRRRGRRPRRHPRRGPGRRGGRARGRARPRRRSPTSTRCSGRCRPSGAGCPSRSPSAGCTRSRAWRPSSRRGRAGPSSATTATCSSSAATSRSRAPTRPGQLDRMRAAVPAEEAAARGLLLAGHRPHAVVAVWMSATRLGRPGLAAPDGVYVSASLKEEFGIAILEAMASGLVVVAPAGGGPPTYVEEGVTGVLADTADPEALAAAVTRALALATDAEAQARADSARDGVRERFGIDTMAAALDDVYRRVAARRRVLTDERETVPADRRGAGS